MVTQYFDNNVSVQNRTGILIVGTALGTLAVCLMAALFIFPLGKQNSAIVMLAFMAFTILSASCFVYWGGKETFGGFATKARRNFELFEEFSEANSNKILLISILVALISLVGICLGVHLLATVPRAYGYVGFPLILISLLGLTPILAFVSD